MPSLGAPEVALPVPDAKLRWRVTGYDLSADQFDRIGAESLNDLRRVLAFAGVDLKEIGRLLDFGCGCGRIMRHLASIAGKVELHGCDIEQEPIDWNTANLPFASYVCNDGMPPLPYGDDFFDVVINHSVFTHLPADYQDAWLAELSRVVKPGGHLALSVAGLHAFGGLVQSYLDWPADPSELKRAINEDGFLYIADDSWSGTDFPDFYHSAFHSPNYVMTHWAEFFTVVGYFPRAALEFQDIVLLRNDVRKTSIRAETSPGSGRDNPEQLTRRP